MYNATGRSVLLCAVFHGSLNAAGVTIYPIGSLTAQLLLVALAWTAAIVVAVASGGRHLGGRAPGERVLR